MDKYIEREKIKTCFAQIIVNNIEDKPYYSIMYWENGEMYIGFSSYKLDYVRRWLNEKFEVKRNVDVVPVVRCKDCKYLVNATVNDNGFLICDISDMEITPDDFCSYGERKDGGADNGSELKPCPFCGSNRISVEYLYFRPYIRCEKCHAQIPCYNTYPKAKEAWNRRANNGSN